VDILTAAIRDDSAITQCGKHIANAKLALAEGKSGLLSKYAVPINKLETAIANIILEKKTLRPVYDTNDLEQIYKSKLTHTYVDKKKILHSTISIPLVNPTDRWKLESAKLSNMRRSFLAMKIINSNGLYRHLSNNHKMHIKKEDNSHSTEFNQLNPSQHRLLTSYGFRLARK